MRFLMLLGILLLVFGPHRGFAQSGDASASSASPFYNNGIQMGTTFCPNATFDCGGLEAAQPEIIAAANACIRDRFNMSEAIMGEFRASGQYENCVLPQRTYDSGGGTGWAVCCVKKAGDGGQCNLFCTRYIGSR